MLLWNVVKYVLKVYENMSTPEFTKGLQYMRSNWSELKQLFSIWKYCVTSYTMTLFYQICPDFTKTFQISKIIGLRCCSGIPHGSKNYSSSHPELFLRKGILKMYSKLTGDTPHRSATSIKLLCNFATLLKAYFGMGVLL